jgi:hypothetical protein
LTSRHEPHKRLLARGLLVRLAAALLLLLAAYSPSQAQHQGPTAAQPPPPSKPPTEDGPFRVTFAEVFKDGKSNFEDLDPATVAPLPKGYELFGKGGYKIDSEVVAAGTHLVEFAFPSVKDRAVFESLRVLRAEWDKVDEKAFWVDSAYAGEGAFKSDFNTRTIAVQVQHLGPFAVARLVEAPVPSTAVVDLSVEIVTPRERINGNTDAHYEVKITNRGPDDAKNIKLQGGGFWSNQFVSADGPERGHGRCKQDGSNYACKLDLLEKGQTAVFRFVLNPRENPRSPYPEEGQDLYFDATAYSSTEQDKNFDDNHTDSWLKVYPDPNRAPSVKVVSPKEGDLYAAPAAIQLAARAQDPEGGIARVTFYDNEKVIGDAVASGKDEYKFDWAGAAPGSHVVTAVVTDNGGRADSDWTRVFVNGPLTVRVESPRDGTVLKTKLKVKSERVEQGWPHVEVEYETVGLEASASVGGTRVKKVAFLLSNAGMGMGRELEAEGLAAGVDRATGETRYTASFKNLNPSLYTLTVVASDEDGVQTVSRPSQVRVSAASPVRLKAEVNDRGPGLTQGVLVNAESVVSPGLEEMGEREARVDFYADGKLIGTRQMDFSGRARFVWEDAAPGPHDLTAVATNRHGAASDPSPPVRIMVKGGRQ